MHMYVHAEWQKNKHFEHCRLQMGTSSLPVACPKVKSIAKLIIMRIEKTHSKRNEEV